MAEKEADDALNHCVDEMRKGADKLGKLHDDDNWGIRPGFVGDLTKGRYKRFLEIFRDRFEKHPDGPKGGQEKWEHDREQVSRMAEYIGILARFYAEAQLRHEITEEDLDKAIATVGVACAQTLKPLDVWCPGS